ncbi:hypothetical protein ACH5RR_027401 [Cinchona calisaya]|uniref:Homeobox domain-containing protein n=1 Tax=Cinchona calisaya TaxID=153742 RepID=A0ABD2Z6H1_9GENT
MSTYFSNLTSQEDVLQTQYLLNSSDLPENMMYQNPPSTASSHSQLISGTSLQAHDFVEAQSVVSRQEMLFIAPHGNTVIMQPINEQLHFAPNFSDSNAVVVDTQVFSKKLFHLQNADQTLQHQGLSLSLGNQVQSSVDAPSYQSPYTNSGFSSLLSSHVEHSADHFSESSELKTAEYLSFDLSGRININSRVGEVYDPQSSLRPKAMNSDPKLHEETVVSGVIYNSKFLKAAQELLDEVVNVRQALKHSDKRHDFHSSGYGVSEEVKLKSECQSGIPSRAGMSPDELSPAERNDLQNKMKKLLSMLDEVDRRYKQYYQQMQVLVSSFEIVAGCGAARSYTALARQTISRQFRCLHDAIKSQIQVVQQSLGEEGTVPNNQIGLSRLRLVDQQLRQQRALQQFGVMRQPWRPQRGLPETAVSVLRAWLFEHFLHPYPKDSEKIMLARQTGLTRSQVANWFINARVRLWKPMIEDMYKEEFVDMEADSKSSQEHPQPTGRLKSESEETGEELHESLMSPGADDGQLRQSDELRNDVTSNLNINAYTTRTGFQDGSLKETNIDSGLNKSHKDGTVSMADHNIFASQTIRTNQTGDAYNFSFLAGTVGNQVSLALGLQHPSKDSQPLSGGSHSGVDDTVASSVDLEKAEYYSLDAINQQDRFSNPHLLPDFVL